MVEQLTNRERQILSLIADGKTTKEIASALDISFKTAVSHRYSAQAKLGAKNAAEMMCRAFRLGLIDMSDGAAPSAAPMARLSGIVAEQSKVREDLRASLKAASTLRRRSSELLGELQTTRRKTQHLVSAIRETTRGSRQPISTRIKPLTNEEAKLKPSDRTIAG